MLELLFVNLKQQEHFTLLTTNKNITFESLLKINFKSLKSIRTFLAMLRMQASQNIFHIHI
jgi:hypothetical protein